MLSNHTPCFIPQVETVFEKEDTTVEEESAWSSK